MNSPTVTLTSEQVEEIARRVSARVAPLDVMSAKDAAEFLRMTPDRFYWWRKRWQVKGCGFGRFSLRAIKAGLEREARCEFERQATKKPVPQPEVAP